MWGQKVRLNPDTQGSWCCALSSVRRLGRRLGCQVSNDPDICARVAKTVNTAGGYEYYTYSSPSKDRNGRPIFKWPRW